METANRRLTASEKRFVHEMKQIMKMTLNELMAVEKTRMPVGL